MFKSTKLFGDFTLVQECHVLAEEAKKLYNGRDLYFWKQEDPITFWKLRLGDLIAFVIYIVTTFHFISYIGALLNKMMVMSS